MAENTMDALMMANDLELDFTETDLWLTKDLVPVIIHGDSDWGMCQMEDTITKEKKDLWITKTNYSELENLVYIKSGASVPTLEQVLVNFQGGGTTKINLEIKDWRPEIVKKTLDVIFKYNMQDRIFFSSFNHKNSITIQKELAKRNLPKDTFGFGYLIDQWYNIPDWESVKEFINPGIDYITLDTQMMYYFWKEDFKEVRDNAKKYGLSLSTFIDMSL